MEQIVEMFCGEDGLYLHRMNDSLFVLVKDAWKRKEELELPMSEGLGCGDKHVPPSRCARVSVSSQIRRLVLQ